MSGTIGDKARRLFSFQHLFCLHLLRTYRLRVLSIFFHLVISSFGKVLMLSVAVFVNHVLSVDITYSARDSLEEQKIGNSRRSK